MSSDDEQKDFTGDDWSQNINDKPPENHPPTAGSTSDPRTSEPETSSSEDVTFPEGGARAYTVAFGASGALICTLGYIYTFGVYQQYYETHQLRNSSPSSISWIGSIQAYFVLGGTAFGGPLLDRYGAKVMWPPAFLLVFAIMMTSICKTYYQFVLAQGLLGGVAAGMTAGPAIAATAHYFNKKRGAAMGLMVGGSSLGGVVFPISLSKMLENPNLGFGWAVRICGFIVMAIIVPSCIAVRARLPPKSGRLFQLSAFKEPLFIVLVAVSCLMMLGFFMPIFFLPSFAVSHGMSTELAFRLVSILNGASLFGRIIPGILADKFGRLNMYFTFGLCTSILLFCWSKCTSNASIIAFAALYGFFSGSILSLMTVAFAGVPKDPRNIGTYMGMGLSIGSFASLIGPPISGAFISHYKSYDQIAIFGGVVVLIATLLTLVAKQTSGKGILGKV